MVTRWIPCLSLIGNADPRVTMEEYYKGDWVSLNDYMALEAELNAAHSKIAMLKAEKKSFLKSIGRN